jgi:predicted GNAT family acetyltransferase
MLVHRYQDAVSFLDRARPFLMRAEAANSLILGVSGPPGSRPRLWREDCYLAVVEGGGQVIACAVRTPPFGVNVTSADRSALEALVEDLIEKYGALPSVYGPEPTVNVFAELWSQRVGTSHRTWMRERLFEAREVQALARRAPGALRMAGEADLPIVADWAEAFDLEARVGTPLDPRRDAEAQVVERRVVVWDDNGPVSVAGWAGRTARGASIVWVYTPPEHRRHGYASAGVADLTQRLLEGRELCWISTDLTNPTTNKIYPAIGYRPVCDRSRIDFDAG